MKNFSCLIDSAEKARYLRIIRAAGAILLDVAGCGDGCYITVQATPAQAEKINADRGRAYDRFNFGGCRRRRPG